MMGVFTTALLFLIIAGIAFAFTNRYVKRQLSKPGLAYRVTAGTAGGLLTFAGVFFITAWGFNPAVIQINLQQSLDPFRWINWLLSALCFGVAQAFLLELLRSRLGTERALEDAPPQGQLEKRALVYPSLQKQEAGWELNDGPAPEQGARGAPTGALEDDPPQHDTNGNAGWSLHVPI